MGRVAESEASPSLALLKYWGKRSVSRNTPATPSLAVALGGLTTRTRVTLRDVGGNGQPADRVTLDGHEQPAERFAPFFDAVRRAVRRELYFAAESTNTFPTASGLASSSSGFAALAFACSAAAERTLSRATLSEIARVGSASAARAVYGGFTLLPAGGRRARALYDESHWPQLRILVTVVRAAAKETGSRDAMELTRRTSPYYRSWVRAAGRALPDGLRALARRDIEELGSAVRSSYLRMFATMFASQPPVFYWLPESVAVIRECEEMRKEGIGVWETMDAGPQVKLICLADAAGAVRSRLKALLPSCDIIECAAGAAPTCRVVEE